MFIMEIRVAKIMRKSIFIFLKYFHYFSTTPGLLLLPFSASILISQPLLSSAPSPFPNIHVLGFSASSTFFNLICIIPFALSSFLMAKASIIRALNHHHEPSLPPFSSCLSLYKPLLLTHLCNMVLSFTANMVAIFLLLIASWFLRSLLQLVTRTVLYALVTNIIVLCNFALVVAGMENCTCYRAIYKACLLRRGTNSMALLLALPTHLGLASIELLFCYRLVRAYQLDGRTSFGMALEGMLIAYLYSLVIVLDTIACWLFIKSCRSHCWTDETNGFCDRI